MSELVDLVNKTNARLLYQSLLKNLSKSETSNEDEYELLNVFEMLWNVMGNKDHEQSLQEESKDDNKEIKGHALCIKPEYL